MRKTTISLLGIILTALLACAAFAAVTFTEVQESRSPERAAPAVDTAPAIEIGPYVQQVTASGVTIMWQANTPASGEVKITGGDTDVTKRTSRVVRLGEVRVEGLEPGTQYTYSVTLEGAPKTAMQGTFRTLPDRPGPIRFIVYGDTRSRPSLHKKVIHAMNSEPDIAFVLHAGDVVADARKPELWKSEFFDPAGEMIRNVPFYVVLGNHEHDSPNYFRYFSLPGNERYYSFDLPGIHIIALDSNQSFDVGTEQYNWLLGDLEMHRSARWKLMFMHHPTYTSGLHGFADDNGTPRERPIREAQALFPSLAKRYGISAIFASHDHAYERSARDGVNYIVTGGGGAPNYPQANARHNRYRQFFLSTVHYCLVSVDGAKASVTAKMPNGKVIDKFDLTIPKPD